MPILNNCEKCGRQFKHTPCEINRKYCSHECYSIDKKPKWKPEDWIGRKFGASTIIEYIGNKRYTSKYGSKIAHIYKAQCECEKIRPVQHWDLKLGKSDKCKSCSQKHKLGIKIGDVFSKWTVLEEAERYNDKRKEGWGCRQFKCRCICGKISIVIGSMLKNKKSTQCLECYRNTGGTHRLSNSPTYKSWRGMMQRCNYPGSNNYYNYGGRGIKVCERWKNSFQNFLDDMGIKPLGNRIGLDRMNPDGDYEPSNCKWSTQKENNENRRNSKKNREKYVYIKKDKLCEICRNIK